MHDVVSDFRQAMREAGLEPPKVIEPGKMHRIPGIGKREGNTAGWCKLFEDGLGGCFGDWASDFSYNWQAKRDKPYSPMERVAFAQRVEETKARAEAICQQQSDNAAAKAAMIWDAATTASDDHPYLVRKKVKAFGARAYKGALVVPVSSAGELLSLQFIAADGSKRFLGGGRISGGYFIVGSVQGASTLCIAEGFATCATIHQATGYPVAVAFNASNLESVAKALRKNRPNITIIICADDDADTESNPGIDKANTAALAVGGSVAIPTFGHHRPAGATDFNDMGNLLGLEAVAESVNRSRISSRSSVEGWGTPLSLAVKIAPEPYPLDAMPETIRNAVEEVHAFTQAPIPLVASSALAAVSLAVQAHTDVKRAEKLQGPVGLFLLTVADSGERKSTCDGFFMQAIRDYEAEQAEAAIPLVKDYKAAEEAWEAKRSGVKEKIRQLAKSGKDTREHEGTLHELEYEKPETPRVPRLIHGDATPEALKWSLAKGWPSGGIMSSEAGLVFGAHGMGKESVMRNLATLNQLWDGVPIATDRRTTDSFTVRGARLTIALQVQEATLRSFFDRSEGLARGTGFLARFLLAWPESTQGFRAFSDPPELWPSLACFNQRISAILKRTAPLDEEGALSPPVLPLSVDAKPAWIAFHDAIEFELRAGGELYDVRDVASKTADNASRIAALFQMFENGSSNSIGLAAFEGASRIAAWHLHEARRFYGELAMPKGLADAARLDQWLLAYCRKEKTRIIPRRDVQRNVTPVNLRHKDALDSALADLVEAGRVRLVHDERRKEIHVNPALLDEDTP